MSINQQLNAEGKRTWVTDTCGCCSYKDPHGDSKCIPFFFPMAMCGTCCAIGRLQTFLTDEQECCCGMGCFGWLSCIFSNALLGPPGFCIQGYCCIRPRVIKKYNVIDDTNVCQSLCYPCSYFQMLVSVTEWETKTHMPSAPPSSK